MKKTRFFGLLLAAVMAVGLMAPGMPVSAEEAPVLEETELTPINSAILSVTQPAIGQSYDYQDEWECSIKDDDGSFYVESLLWLKADGTIPSVFEAGQFYYCDIMLAPAAGYRLHEGTTCMINGFPPAQISYMEGNRIWLRSSQMGPCMGAPEIDRVYNSANNDAVIIWYPVAGADSYNCYFREYPNGSFGSPTTVTGENRFRATGLTPGAQYQFALAAYSSAYGLGNLIHSEPFTYVGQPGAVTVTPASTGTTVSWGPAAGASGYLLRYGEKDSGIWEDEIEVIGTTNTVGPRTFRGGVNYEISVYATAADGTESAPSGALIMGQFSDVLDQSQFYYNPVYWAAQKNITTGWDDNTFRPMNTCNRAAVVTFLWRMANCPTPHSMATFSDMPADTPANSDFRNAISWAVEEGITTGYTDNTFRPWATCNRAAVVTFLWRYAGKPYPDPMNPVSFSDSTGNKDFDDAIAWAASYEITTGYDDGTFRPWNTCNRLAVVTFLYRLGGNWYVPGPGPAG